MVNVANDSTYACDFIADARFQVTYALYVVVPRLSPTVRSFGVLSLA